MADPDEIRFRVLGPLEFFDGERWHPIAATKQRSLLAALLLHAGRVVPADQLVAQLWGEQVPASVQTLLAGYAWRLRRTIGDPEGRVLATRPPGYRLVTSPGQIDVDEYETLTGRSRAHLAAGRLVEAVDGFAAALSLWRGVPFADVPATPDLTAETARLEESRLAAIEMRIGAQLDLGQHEEILPDLRLVVSQYPLRERLQAHLMVALYRAGQPAEALGAYRDLRQLLVDELGIEPSDPLRVLERRILSNDPALLRSPAGRPVTVRAPVLAPRRLPPDLGVFVGRADEVRRLTAVVTRNDLVVVHGLAGAGKTSLAVHIAHAVAERYPDGQVLVNMRAGGPGEPTSAAEAVETVARMLGVPPPEGDPVAAWPALLTGRRVLIVFDDAASAAQVRELVNVPAGNAVMVTARPALSTLDAADRLRLGALSTGDSMELLRRHLGARRLDLSGPAAAEVVRFCGQLPLALRIAVARLAAHPGWSMDAFARRLADRSTRLDVLACDDLSMRDSFQAAVRALTRAGRDESLVCLRRLGALDPPLVDVDVLAALLDRSAVAAEAVAEHLVDVGLIEALSVGRYRIPELTRAFAGECGIDDSGPKAVKRVMAHYCWAATEQLAALTGAEAGSERSWRVARAWWRQERGTLIRMADRPGGEELAKLVAKLRALLLGPARVDRRGTSRIHRRYSGS